MLLLSRFLAEKLLRLLLLAGHHGACRTCAGQLEARISVRVAVALLAPCWATVAYKVGPEASEAQCSAAAKCTVHDAR
jgi:hypothetical protein